MTSRGRVSLISASHVEPAGLRWYLGTVSVGTEGLGRHTRLRSKLWGTGDGGGTEDCGRHRGVMGGTGIGEARRLRARRGTYGRVFKDHGRLT